jgi:L-rhamnose mutarotase
MGKYLTIWRNNLDEWPSDPTEAAKLAEMMWATMDEMIKSGNVQETGFFLDGNSGYTIAEGKDSAEGLRAAAMFSPFVEWVDYEEIVPFEKGKEVFRAVWKAKAEAMKR